MVSQSPDMKTGPEGPVRAPSAVPIDDAVLPYEVDALDVRGRLVRLGPALDEILTRHDYPAPVGKLLGEAIVLTTLLGSALKFEGRFILQAQTDGPVSFLVVDYNAPDRLRAYARYFYIGRRFQDDSNLSRLPGYDMADIGFSVSNDNGVTLRALVNNITNEIGLTEGNARAAVLGTGTVGDATVGRSIFGRNFTLSIEKKF